MPKNHRLSITREREIGREVPACDMDVRLSLLQLPNHPRERFGTVDQDLQSTTRARPWLSPGPTPRGSIERREPADHLQPPPMVRADGSADHRSQPAISAEDEILGHENRSLQIRSRRRSLVPSREQWSMVLHLKEVLLLGLMLAVVGAGCGGGGKLGAKALSQQAMSLQSDAAEGALLAQHVSSGKTTRIYTRERSAELSKAASQIEASLKTAKTAPGLEGKLRRLAAIATRVSTELKHLGNASKDEARALRRELEAAAAESKRIGNGLE
jgi:hypothetical protein